jgi:signal transduction histidine kinase
MLSEILTKYIPQHNEKERKIIEQIQQSASEMYAGTKDILWALNPDNDNLAEVVTAIEMFAENLFMSSGFTVNFNVDRQRADLGNIKLPLGHSRNITLIFKELFTNILKHSKGDIVTFTAEITSNEQVSFKVTDNGNGFDTSHVFAGNGIRNMQNRAKKLNATLSIDSQEKHGTTSTLLIPIP